MPVVGPDVIAVVKEYFGYSFLLSRFNSTSLVLVPKKKCPQTIIDFRPIACCQVVYRCITKMLANRMKLFLPTIISGNQSAFVKGRCISENFMLAQELVNGYKGKKLSPRFAIKVDLRKAFDSIDWCFLLDVLTAMHFPAQFISWIAGYVTKSKFSLVINGGLVGYFDGGKGLRQGDPLSPYLFVIVMEVFSQMINAAARLNFINYHPKCKKIGLTHLIFADDLFIFIKGNLDSVVGVKRLLDLFYVFSGLQVNCLKSEIFCSGIPNVVLETIKIETGFVVGQLPVRYLGVPRHLSIKDCQPLIDKITARVKHWTSKLLSYAGKLQLI